MKQSSILHKPLDFFGIIELAFKLFLLLLITHGVKEEDLVFFESTKLVRCFNSSFMNEQMTPAVHAEKHLPSFVFSSHSSCFAILFAASFCT